MNEDLIQVTSLEEAIQRIGLLLEQHRELRYQLDEAETELSREITRNAELFGQLVAARKPFLVRLTRAIYHGIADAKCSLTRLKWFAKTTDKYRCVDCQKLKFSTQRRVLVDYYPGHSFKQCSNCAQLAERTLGFRYAVRPN